MSPQRAVVVTGLGVVSPVGIGVPAFWEGCLSGRSGAQRLTHPWFSPERFRTHVGAPVEGFDLVAHGFAPRDTKTLDPACWYALAAAKEALLQAGFRVEIDEAHPDVHVVRDVDVTRVATVIGSGVGGLSSFEAVHARWVRGQSFAGAAWLRWGLPMLIPNAPTANVAIKFGFGGECTSAPTACAAGSMSIGEAWRLVRDGEADMAVAGGADGILTDHDGLGLLGFDLLKVMTTRNDDPQGASRPFDRGRDGFVLGEGAGVLVLESREHCAARGGRPLAEILSYAATCDAHSMMQPAPDGRAVERAFDLALRRAEVRASDVGYVNAHATSTPAGDRVEAAVIRRVFGTGKGAPSVSATKSMTGHCIGASGAIEAVATVRTLMDGLVHPTLNLDDVDPDCELNHVVGAPRRADVEVAASASFGFGGHDAVLIFRRVR